MEGTASVEAVSDLDGMVAGDSKGHSQDTVVECALDWVDMDVEHSHMVEGADKASPDEANVCSLASSLVLESPLE